MGSYRSWSVGGRGRWERTVGIAVGGAFLILEAASARRYILLSAVDTRIFFTDLCEALERSVVKEDEEVMAETFDAPDGAIGDEVEWPPVALIAEAGTVDAYDEVERAVWLFLFRGGIEPVNAGVMVQAERTGAVGDDVPVREDEDGRDGKAKGAAEAEREDCW